MDVRKADNPGAAQRPAADPADYDAVLAEMRETGGCTTLSTRRRLQVKVYQTTAAYDTAISRWLAAQASDVADTSAKLEISLEKVDDLRYGENPQQKATVYRFAEGCENTASSQFPLVGSEQIQGKPLSYNNYLDADAAWNLVREFDEPACVILKHQNPCVAGHEGRRAKVNNLSRVSAAGYLRTRSARRRVGEEKSEVVRPAPQGRIQESGCVDVR